MEKKNWAKRGGNTPHLALHFAQDLLENIEYCNCDNSDGDGTHIGLAGSVFDQAAYGTRDNDKILNGQPIDDYFSTYKSHWILAPYPEHWCERVEYMQAKLEGIVEGNVTTGDGHLGEELRQFTSRMQDLLEEQEKDMSPEVFALYKGFLDEMQQNFLNGARQGLFASGNPLIEIRGRSK